MTLTHHDVASLLPSWIYCIISSFPQCRKNRQLIGADVQIAIIANFSFHEMQTISTVQELAALITNHCARNFGFEEASRGIETPKIVDMYDEALQILVSEAAQK